MSVIKKKNKNDKNVTAQMRFTLVQGVLNIVKCVCGYTPKEWEFAFNTGLSCKCPSCEKTFYYDFDITIYQDSTK